MTLAIAEPRLALLQAIAGHWREHGYAPSYADLMAALCVRSRSSLAYALQDGRSRGLLTFDDHRQRTIRLTERGEAMIA